MEGKVYEANPAQREILNEIEEARAVLATNLNVLARSLGVPKGAHFEVLPDRSGFLVLPPKP